MNRNWSDKVDLNAVHAVIFDLGRVLVGVDFTRGLIRHLATDKHLTDQQILDYVFRDPLFKKFSKGQIQPHKFFQKIASRYDLDLSYDEFVHAWCDIFSPVEGMEEIVREVASKFTIGLLSDIDLLHWEFLSDNYPILKLFPQPVLSFRIRALKPSPACYRAAAQSVGFEARFCLFIDDRPINILGAKKFGMQAILFQNQRILKEQLQQLGLLS